MLDRAVLKENQILVVSDTNGDIRAGNPEGHGLYWRDTRFLSVFEVLINNEQPQLLSSAGEHNFMTNLQFANPAMTSADGELIPPRTVSIRRNRFLHNGLHERIGVSNYNARPVLLDVRIRLGSDFRDMFDVRGYLRRTEFGTMDPPVVQGAELTLTYTGLDEVRRETHVHFDREPDEVILHASDPAARADQELQGISASADPRLETSVDPAWAEARFRIEVPPSQFRVITMHIEPRIEDIRPVEVESSGLSLDQEFVLVRDSYTEWNAGCTEIQTDNEMINEVIYRSVLDLRLLSDQVQDGYIPSAGIPWFAVPFGRDSLVTSIQSLILHPNVAYATLRFLAQHQGTSVNPWRDEEPGKILHEIRLGEVAALGKVPHTPYYGSVDSTPLFLVALSEFLRWSGDVAFARAMRPHVEAALEWIDKYGDLNGDTFVEYESKSTSGIRNQGWKDSRDAIRHQDGRLVNPPIALSEVQGYVYDAKRRMSEYFQALGDSERAAALKHQADDLWERFDAAFWLPDQAFYAMALGPKKEPVRTIGSNPGHALWSGLVPAHRSRAVVGRLLSDDLCCGWGIRTLSSQEPHFNPMSYHNGSVWPHDNSLIVAGLKRYGFDREAARVAGEILDAAVRFPLFRLPEVYCGFARDRRYFSMPAQYPASCSPQSWAAASVFLLIQSVLGLRVDALSRRILLRPWLPDGVSVIHLRGLRVAGYRLEVWVRQVGERVDVETSDPGPLTVVVQQAREPIEAAVRAR